MSDQVNEGAQRRPIPPGSGHCPGHGVPDRAVGGRLLHGDSLVSVGGVLFGLLDPDSRRAGDANRGRSSHGRGGFWELPCGGPDAERCPDQAPIRKPGDRREDPQGRHHLGHRARLASCWASGWRRPFLRVPDSGCCSWSGPRSGVSPCPGWGRTFPSSCSLFPFSGGE